MRSGNYKPSKPVYQGRWPTIRKQILRRDGYHCQIGLPGCTENATTVDHITPVAWGGEWYEPSNLRASCASCNTNLAAIAKKYKPKAPTIQTTERAGPTPTRPSRSW